MPIVLVGIPLLLILTAFVAYGMSQVTKGWSDGFLGWFEQSIVNTIVGVSWIANQAVKLTRWLSHELGKHFEQVVRFAVQWVAGLDQYIKTQARAALAWPFELSNALHWLVYKEIPRIAKAVGHFAAHEAHQAVTILRPVTRIVYRVPKISKAAALAAIAAVLPHGIRADLPLLRWIREHFKALEHAAANAGSIATTVPRIIYRDYSIPVGRTLRQIRARLRKLEKITAGSLAVGAVALALTRMGVNWIRCNNVKRVGRALCSAPSHVISDLLGLLVDVVIVEDICQVIVLLEQGLSVLEGPLNTFVGVVDGALCHGDYQRPPALGAAFLSLPPVTGVALSLP